MKTLSSKIKTFVTILFFLTLLSACQPENYVMFQDIHGNQYPLKDYYGKWVVINYWASWCKPCYSEIPEINAFAERFKKSVLVLGVSYDQEKGAQLIQSVKKIGVAFPTLSFDPAEELGVKHIRGLPTTLLINPKGKLVKILYGKQTQNSLAQAMNLR